MKNEYLQGVGKVKGKNLVPRIINLYISGNHYEPLRLIIKYGQKNKEVLTEGLNYIDENGETPLIVLLKQKHCSNEWLNLLLFSILEAIPEKELKIDEKTLEKAYNMCKYEIKNQEWAQLILKYSKQVQQDIPATK